MDVMTSANWGAGNSYPSRNIWFHLRVSLSFVSCNSLFLLLLISEFSVCFVCMIFLYLILISIVKFVCVYTFYNGVSYPGLWWKVCICTGIDGPRTHFISVEKQICGKFQDSVNASFGIYSNIPPSVYIILFKYRQLFYTDLQ